ncbi:ferredoxin--nitrite reductase [Anaerosporomusa subterranea]|uniref:Ferredoxin--nitrite reductase n=1 Tax=Anaerosporomusa subterranea TaxID=1794912 RepID=A0A154BLZ2_ANASB|nr:ferredoxin--nitrite reductase [Anaerosporomusa subterranea]KYZ74935.1 ferredoxin--nitrite reductase [Anaerosporomusa subterranea]
MEPVWAQDRSKLNKVELIKLEKDGLDIINDIERFAKLGFAAIEEKDFDLLKWLGLYISRPKEDGFFLLRVKIPGGVLTSLQARTLGKIARDYGRNLLDISTRHAIQFHWIRVEYLPDIFARLALVGLSCIESAGDCPRTIVGNPLAGYDQEEVIDASPILKEVSDFFHNNREFSNLPRKFKISISGSIHNPASAEIHDLSFTPAEKQVNGETVIGFHVKVGGGLSAAPYMAQDLDLFVLPSEVLSVAKAVATIFRDFGYREKRNHARLKFLLQDWGVEKFQEELINRTGPLASRGKDLTVDWNAGCSYGLHQQVQSGLNYLGLSIPLGRFYADEIEELATIAETYGDGSIRTTNSQDLILPNIPDAKTEAVLSEKVLTRLTPFPKPFTAHAISCTGTQFCPLGVAETKQRAAKILEYLDQHVELDTPIVVHFSGCVNSCGQNQIADIGLQGTVAKVGDQIVEAFTFSIGGRLGPQASFGIKLKGSVPADRVAKAVESLVNAFKAHRAPGESFSDVVKRIGTDAFQLALDKFI